MIADLLEANRRGFPAPPLGGRATAGSGGVHRAHRDASVTLWFDRGAVTVVDGAAVGAPSAAGPWLTMTRVCSGRCSPARAWRDGELALAGPSGARAGGRGLRAPGPSSDIARHPPTPPSGDWPGHAGGHAGPGRRRWVHPWKWLGATAVSGPLAAVRAGPVWVASCPGPRPPWSWEWSHRWLAATVGVLAVVTEWSRPGDVAGHPAWSARPWPSSG